MTLAAVVAEAARRFGHRPAIVAPDGWPLGYAELDRSSDEVAAGLVTRGVGPGDVIALVLPSSPDYLVAYAAVAKIGAITAGINPRSAPEQRRAMLEVAEPALVVATEDLAGGADGWPTQDVTVAQHPGGCLAPLRRPGGSPARVAPDPDRVVAVVFTSGTSGIPRAAVFTERHLQDIGRMDAGDRWGGGEPLLASTELVHVGVMTKLPWYLRTGSTLHVLRRWRAADALEVISRERITSVGAIAPQVALLLREPDFDRFDLRHVTTIVAGGAPSPPALVAEARRRFGAAYSIRYSSTESGGVGTATAFDAPDSEALHTVGRPRPGVEVEIRDDAGNAQPAGATGTVWLRSPAVMAGYRRDDAATANALRDGWLRSDDLGWIDEAGCLHLAGRAGDSFIRGGYNVHPEIVEAVLRDHPGVADVAVVPRADDVLGNVGVAVVVAQRGAPAPELADLRRFAASRLAHHELPEALELVAQLPRTAVDKLDRAGLRLMLGARQG